MKTHALEIPIFVMHYKPLKERKIFMIQQMKNINSTNHVFIEEFDREEITQGVRDEYYTSDYDVWMSRYFLTRKILTENAFFNQDKKTWSEGVPHDRYVAPNARILKGAEISLALKHIEAYKIISKRNLNYAMIIEDDVIFCENFVEKLSAFFMQTPADWDIIFFGNGCNFRVPGRNIDQLVYNMHPPRSKCSDSYLISSRAAGKLLNHIIPFTQPIDFELGYWMHLLKMNCYWWDPPLTTQGSQTGQVLSSIQ